MDAEQEKLMEEMLILVDDNDCELDSESKRNCHFGPAKLHRAFSLFIFYDGKLLLQKRSRHKVTFPLMWTNTCCSHPLYNEIERDGISGAKMAVIRKVQQELGIIPDDIPTSKLEFITKILYKAPSGNSWAEHEVDYIFIMNKFVTVAENWNEVSETRWVDKEELKQMLAGEDSFTPWFRLISRQFLFDWWEKLSDLSQLKDSIIHNFIE